MGREVKELFCIFSLSIDDSIKISLILLIGLFLRGLNLFRYLV